MQCQDPRGGLSDRPMDERDLYHTYFGIAGLNMLGYLADHDFPSISIHPAFALPVPVVERMGMSFVAVSISPLMSIFTTTEAAEIESSFGIGMKHEMVLFRFTVPWIYDEGQET